MFLRAILLVLGLGGAGLAAQFPAYAQQYIQRLGGAVDALHQVVADFDASAAALDLTRAEALAQMQGNAFLLARRMDMQRTFARHAKLAQDLRVLQGQGPFMQAYSGARLTDPEIARAALAAFQPALPLTFATLVFGFCGFATVTVALAAVGQGLRFLCGVRKPA